MSVSFDRVAEIYDRTRGLPTEAMAKLIETLATQLKKRERLLDIGVGTGRFAEPLQEAGFNVVGIDISKKMIGKAKEKGVKNLLLSDARFLPFENKSFDVTISVHVLHLISEWQKTLREVCRVTRHAMFSLYDAHKDPVRETYRGILEKYGYEQHHHGTAEQDLKNIITPAKLLFATSYKTYADELLINLQHRTSSSQWEIPAQVNLKAVKQLKSQFAGKTFTQELYLVIWDIETLKNRFSTDCFSES